MEDDTTSTIRLRRATSHRVTTDAVGGTVWDDTIETVEFELVSTAMLKVMLDDDHDSTRLKLRAVADSGEGLLARSKHSASFEVVDKHEVRDALSAEPDTRSNATHAESPPNTVDELSLVSTQMIKVMLERPELTPEQVSDELQLVAEAEAAGGFDPYNKN
ncbi:MAG: hypothetical protein AAGJ86_11475 [Pseudomonadota bacterium]